MRAKNSTFYWWKKVLLPIHDFFSLLAEGVKMLIENKKIEN